MPMQGRLGRGMTADYFHPAGERVVNERIMTRMDQMVGTGFLSD